MLGVPLRRESLGDAIGPELCVQLMKFGQSLRCDWEASAYPDRRLKVEEPGQALGLHK